MTINLFSLEILIGLIIGLLLGVVAKSYFSKTETKDDDVSNISFENAIFFTHGPVDKNIPLIKTAKYILHHCDEEKYQNVDYIKYQVYTSGKENCYGFSGKKMDEYVYYNEKTNEI